MRIGELEHRTGVSQRALRYYEEQRLLHPQRRPSGYRVYAESDVLTVRHIRTLLAAGLSTETIAELLPCMGLAGERLVADCPELLVDLFRERDRLNEAISDLRTTREALDDVIATAPRDVVNAAHRELGITV